jgi:hypothetical protein
MPGHRYKSITADAGYESEENYAYCAENKQWAYIKPANYERMKTKKYREGIGKRENKGLGGETDGQPRKQSAKTENRPPTPLKNRRCSTSFTAPC